MGSKGLMVWGLGIAALLSACGSAKKIQALKPDASYPQTIAYDKQTSLISLPVELTVADLQAQTNKLLNGLVYEDNQMEGDNLTLKIWKQAPVAINENGGKLDIALPLKIQGSVRYGIEKFGISAYDTRDFNLNGVFKVSSQIGFANWKLTTNTQVGGIDWVEAPGISIAGKTLPLTLVVNPAVGLFKAKIAKAIDDAIARSVDIKPLVANALEEIAKPIEVNKDFHVTFAMQPTEVFTNQAVVANKKISLLLGMKAYMETAVNTKPSLRYEKSKLAFTAATKNANEFIISVAGIATYEGAAKLMEENFKGKTFGEGKKALTVNSVGLWGKEGKMVVALGLIGAVNGDIYLTGVPTYDSVRKEVFVDQLDFVLDTKNQLLKFGNWLLHGTVLKKIKESCRYPLAPQLSEAEKTIKNYLTNYEPAKGIKVNGALYSFAPQRITLTPNAIVQMITASGKASITVDGIQ